MDTLSQERDPRGVSPSSIGLIVFPNNNNNSNNSNILYSSSQREIKAVDGSGDRTTKNISQ